MAGAMKPKKALEEVELFIDEHFHMWKFPKLKEEYDNVYSRITVIDVDGYETTTSFRELDVKRDRPFDVHLGKVGKQRITFEKWKAECSLKHNNKYDYSLIDVNQEIIIQDNLPIVCPIHGEFMQQGNVHLRGHGCPKCTLRSISLLQLQWMLWIEETTGAEIQHFFNGGEYKLPKLDIRIDGFDSKTNTVYEFHGDAYHGNPKIYPPKEYCSPRNKHKTAEELYSDTKRKELSITSAGYNLVTMWESDWLQLIKKDQKIITDTIHKKIGEYLNTTPVEKLNAQLAQYGFKLDESQTTFDWRVSKGLFQCLKCDKSTTCGISGKVRHAKLNNYTCLKNCESKTGIVVDKTLTKKEQQAIYRREYRKRMRGGK